MKNYFIYMFTFFAMISLFLSSKDVGAETYHFTVDSAKGEVTLVNTKKGYEGGKAISTNDLHYGWSLGDFTISGYSKKENNDITTFYKTTGESIILKFNLEQDISNINGKNISVIDDKSGQDVSFGTDKTDFKKGALLIRHTKSDNTVKTFSYTDFLTGKAQDAKNMEVKLTKDGIYEVALDYRLKEEKFSLFEKNLLWDTERYRMSFTFEVKNGRAMGYLKDIKTNKELDNNSKTSNGFKINLVNASSVDVEVKREVWTGESWDSKGVETAISEKEYTKKGKYTITFKNEGVSDTTKKVIYVKESKHD